MGDLKNQIFLVIRSEVAYIDAFVAGAQSGFFLRSVDVSKH